MAIKLALFFQTDLAGKPALFLMGSSFPDSEVSYGLGARMRTFHFTGELIEALAPAKLEPGFLRELANDLERGTPHQLEISNEQAADIGMLPQRDGSQWVRITVRKIETGGGSFCYCESYQVGNRDVNGNGMEATLGELETRVRRFVALDWKAIETQLDRQDAVTTVLHLPDETVRYIFDGELG